MQKVSNSKSNSPAEETRVAEILDRATEDLKKLDMGLKIVSHEYIESELRLMVGKVLTIIDASIPERQQNKCVKDLVKSEFYARVGSVRDWYRVSPYMHNGGIEPEDGYPRTGPVETI